MRVRTALLSRLGVTATTDEVRQLREENDILKKAVANLMLDIIKGIKSTYPLYFYAPHFLSNKRPNGAL
jgi:hypothetical protein